MRPHDTMRSVPKTRSPLPPDATPRQVVGKTVRDLIYNRGMTVSSAGRASRNCGKSTLDRIIAGAETVTDGPLQSIAGTLRLPLPIFLLMIDRDIAEIKKLTMDESDREYILRQLNATMATPKRRASDG